MKITIFQLKSNPDIGFSINEDLENKYDKWTHIDEFGSFDDAMNYILENHGEVEKMAVY
jgi:hypothetical protein